MNYYNSYKIGGYDVMRIPLYDTHNSRTNRYTEYRLWIFVGTNQQNNNSPYIVALCMCDKYDDHTLDNEILYMCSKGYMPTMSHAF